MRSGARASDLVTWRFDRSRGDHPPLAPQKPEAQATDLVLGAVGLDHDLVAVLDAVAGMLRDDPDGRARDGVADGARGRKAEERHERELIGDVGDVAVEGRAGEVEREG